MSDEVEPGLSDQYRKASPWPLFVALGIVLSEIGVVLGVFPVTVGGLLLFGATVAGILRESGYVSRPAVAMSGIGLLLAGVGLLTLLVQVDLVLPSLEVMLDRTRPFVYRGTAVGTAGVILVGVAVAVFLSRATRP